MLKLGIAFFLCIYLNAEAFSQKEILKEANLFLEQKLFSDALNLYNQIPQIKNKNTLRNKAICLIETSQLIEAETLINDLLTSDSKNPELLFYRAYLFQQQEHYQLALQTYKNVLKKAKSKDPIKKKARQQIKKCRATQKISFQTELAFIENLGSQINTKYNDFGAIQSPNFPNLIYFNSDRITVGNATTNNQKLNRQSDMYSYEFNNGSWSFIPVFDVSLNSKLDEQIFGFPPNGSSLIYSQKNFNGLGKIKINHFIADSLEQSNPINFNSKIKAELGDNYIQVFSDTVFLYSSLRTEGIGEYDIFAIKLQNGNWKEPIHFGNKINSTYNEICPFLTKDGQQLFFSSDRPESIGGYDIFMSEFDDKLNKWSDPKNLGLPINSINNDLYFKLDNNGNSANFSSDRIGGFGGIDLYVAYLKEQNLHNDELSNHIPFLRYAEEQLKTELLSSQQNQENIQEAPIEKENQNIFKRKALFFNTSDRLVYGKQEDYISQLITILKENPRSSVTVLSHSADSGEFNFQLYSSVRQTEELVSHFINNGISKDRIFVIGFGNSFPLKDSFIQNRVDGNQMNKRVTFTFQHLDSQNLIIEDSELSKNTISTNYITYNNSIKELSYAIEFAKTQQLFKHDGLKNLQPIKVEKIDDFYHYSIGSYQSYSEAKQSLTNIEKFNFPSSKIIAYIDGRRFNKSEFSTQLKKYPDLADYIIESFSNK